MNAFTFPEVNAAARSPFASRAVFHEHRATLTLYDDPGNEMGTLDLVMAFEFVPSKSAAGYGEWHTPSEALMHNLHSATMKGTGALLFLTGDARHIAETWLSDNGREVMDAIEAKAGERKVA